MNPGQKYCETRTLARDSALSRSKRDEKVSKMARINFTSK